MRRRNRLIVGFLLILGSVVFATATYALRPELFPRLDDLPKLDKQKAKTLSPERRAELEHELFAELRWWDMSSRRYAGRPGRNAREARWREMAASEGFELAEIVLRVLDPSSGTIFSMRGPMRRLQSLAEKGDLGAMCLMVGLVNRASRTQDWQQYQADYSRWLVKGAELGHPECMDQLGGRLISGVDGFRRDVKEGLSYKRRAVSLGYVHGAGAMARYYYGKGLSDETNVRRIHCWSSVADTTFTVTMDREYDRAPIFLRELEQSAVIGDSLKRLAEELRQAEVSVQDCIDLGLEE